jgi:hypothetical protein
VSAPAARYLTPIYRRVRAGGADCPNEGSALRQASHGGSHLTSSDAAASDPARGAESHGRGGKVVPLAPLPKRSSSLLGTEERQGRIRRANDAHESGARAKVAPPPRPTHARRPAARRPWPRRAAHHAAERPLPAVLGRAKVPSSEPVFRRRGLSGAGTACVTSTRFGPLRADVSLRADGHSASGGRQPGKRRVRGRLPRSLEGGFDPLADGRATLALRHPCATPLQRRRASADVGGLSVASADAPKKAQPSRFHPG